MNVLKRLRWPVMVCLTILYIVCKSSNIGGNLINLFSIAIAGIIFTLPLEQKVYSLFFFLHSYLYIYIFSFAFYNVIYIAIFFHMMFKKDTFPQLKVIIPTAILLIYELFMHIYYENNNYSYLIKWILAFFVTFNLMNCKKVNIDKYKTVFIYGLGTTIIAISTILQYSSIELSLGNRGLFRGGLESIDPNTFSLYCLLTISLCTYAIFDKNIKLSSPFYQKYKKTVYFPLFIFICFSFVAGAQMLSKAFFLTTIGWAVLFFMFNLFNRKNIKKSLVFATIVTIIVIAILNIQETKAVVNMILTRFGDIENIDQVTTGRSAIIRGYIRELIKAPNKLFFGSGLMTYQSVIDTGIYHPSGESVITHNIILEIVCAYGLVGFLLLIVAYISVFKTNFTLKNMKDLNKFIPLIIFLVFTQSLALYREAITHAIILLCFISCMSDTTKIYDNSISKMSQIGRVCMSYD